MGGKWILRHTETDTARMAEALSIDGAFASVLANRGINSRKAANGFINPSLKDCADFSAAADCDNAALAVISAAERGERICVYGDYDVDGVMSTVILVKAVTALIAAIGKTRGGCVASVSFMLPLREKDGYGLNIIRAREIAGGGAKLLITCDNGITAHNEIALLNELNVTTVVIDHHEPLLSGIPAARAVIDPKRIDCAYPFKQMCAAALCMRFAARLFRVASAMFGDAPGFRYEGFYEALSLASIATFCDIVELTGENRAIAKAGMDVISGGILGGGRRLNTGLAALLKERGVKHRKFTAFDAGFVIGPCVNACGRLESAETAVKLFLTEDAGEARELSARLSSLNEARKTATEAGAAAALKIARSKEYSSYKALCIYDNGISEAVAGIVAGRVRERLGKPTIILTDSALPDGTRVVKGSCRSIEGFDIFKALYEARDLFIRFGGHPMAAGLTILPEHIDELRHTINENCGLTEEDFTRKLYIDAVVPLEFASLKNAEFIERFEPFGKGCEQPLFVSKAKVIFADLIGAAKTTLRVSLKGEGGFFIQGVMFNGADYLAACKGNNGEGREIEAAYHLEINDFRGERAARLRLVDIDGAW